MTLYFSVFSMAPARNYLFFDVWHFCKNSKRTFFKEKTVFVSYKTLLWKWNDHVHCISGTFVTYHSSCLLRYSVLPIPVTPILDTGHFSQTSFFPGQRKTTHVIFFKTSLSLPVTSLCTSTNSRVNWRQRSWGFFKLKEKIATTLLHGTFSPWVSTRD